MKNTINLIVKDDENGQRVDQFISNKEKDLSRTRIKNLILNKKLKINKILFLIHLKKLVLTIILISKYQNQRKHL